MDKFAWFYQVWHSNSHYRIISSFIDTQFYSTMQRNNSDSYDGVFNVFTGADHISKMGEMDLWNYTSQTKYVLYENFMNEISHFF